MNTFVMYHCSLKVKTLFQTDLSSFAFWTKWDCSTHDTRQCWSQPPADA